MFDRLLGNIPDDSVLKDEINDFSLPRKKNISGRIYHLNKGWGLISADEGQDNELDYERIFFHWTGLENRKPNFKELSVGDKVRFECFDIPEKGWRAIHIVIVDDREKESNHG